MNDVMLKEQFNLLPKSSNAHKTGAHVVTFCHFNRVNFSDSKHERGHKI